MPSSPEIRDAFRRIRIIKVLHKLKSQHLSETDRHIRISAEVKINLHRIGKTSDPGSQHRSLRCAQYCDRLIDTSHVVGDQNFFPKSLQKPHHTVAEFPDRHRPFHQLLFHVRIPHDRSRDQLREHRHICAECDRIVLCLYFSAVNVDHIGHRLECVKRDPDRQRKLCVRNVERQDRIQILDHKSVIFIKS